MCIFWRAASLRSLFVTLTVHLYVSCAAAPRLASHQKSAIYISIVTFGFQHYLLRGNSAYPPATAIVMNALYQVIMRFPRTSRRRSVLLAAQVRYNNSMELLNRVREL